MQEQQIDQEETRSIMNKRRKRMPLVEEYNLDDILGDIEKESLVSQMKRKV